MDRSGARVMRARAGAIPAPVEAVVPEVVILRPGQVHFASEPAVVRTVLGSCLAATMHCARLRAGAICHALYPGGGPPAGDEAFRYVDRSIEAMADWLGRVGARRGEIEVKLFGGAGTGWSGDDGLSPIDVGRLNVEAAIGCLAARGLRVAARDVGGTAGRKLFFFSRTGEVYVKRLSDRPAPAGARAGRGRGPGERP